MNATEHLKNYSVWTLTGMAECTAPDTTDSPGAEFLDRVRTDVVENWDRLADHDDPDYDGAASEIADSVVPVYTADLWATFVDLAAYHEDVTEYGPIESLDQAARVALYVIAERLVYALVEEGKELGDDTEEEDN